MKFIKNFVWGVLILFIVVVLLSVETDLFVNIEEYVPKICERFPVIVKVADEIEDMTDDIPSLSQILASIKNKPLPVDTDDLAKGSYNELSPMLNFYDGENIGMIVNNGTELSVFGILKESDRQNILIVLTDADGKELTRATSGVSNLSFEFRRDIKIPKTDSIINVNVYTGEKAYGEFESWVIDYISLEKNEQGKWQIQKSPVSEHNKRLYSDGKSISDGLKKTDAINPESKAVKSIAEQLTSDIEDDYDKLLILHDWVCSYLYYNIDYVNDSKIAPYVDTEVLKSRKVVCLGYSNLFASLCRSINIPCYVVSGYALGIDSEATKWNQTNIFTEESNHAWNEAYVNGRWVIVDTTWDSFNTYENSKMEKSEKNSRLYFDANPEFFSKNHKIIKYLKN